MSLRNFFCYPIVLLLTLIAFFILGDMRNADYKVPFYYNLNKDFILHETYFWNFVETGSATLAPRLGAPDNSDSRRFPIDSVDRFDWLIVKLLKAISHDFVFLINTYYLWTYVACSLSALFTFRLLGFGRSTSIIGALLFSFQPYHWFQSVGHLFLSSYYMVPLLGLITIWLVSDENNGIFWKQSNLEEPHTQNHIRSIFRIKIDLLNFKSVISIITIIIASGTGSMYYLLMCVILWFFVGIHHVSSNRKYFRLFDVISLIGLSLFVCIMQLLPTLLYLRINRIPSISRSAADVSENSLDLFWLFLPSVGHRSNLLRKFVTFGNYFNEPSDHLIYPLGEKCFSSLGFTVGFGLVIILISAWLCLKDKMLMKRMNSLIPIVVIGIFISTTNGINRLMAYIPSFPVRAWNRFSIFLAFFAIVAILCILEELRMRLFKRGLNKDKFLYYCIVMALTCFGLWDQSPSIWIPNHTEAIQRWYSDKAFVDELEDSLPKGSLVFNLPLSSYPEGIGHPKAHLHSSKLHWSFGAYKGSGFSSESAKWQSDVLQLPGDELLNTLRIKGFSGIIVEDDPQKSEILRESQQNRIDSMDFELRYRMSALLELDKIEKKIQSTGLKPVRVNDRGDWRYYSLSQNLNQSH
ncbi:MAG: hypothetical protein RJA81_1093 [Planctomycetota bacterium]